MRSAWFKDACTARLHAICNCCKCCCGGVEAMVKYGVPVLASSGDLAEVGEVLCGACGTCEDTCPFGAVQVNGLGAVNWETCMGCGVCAGQCPNQAIGLARHERKGNPLDVRLLAQEHMVA